MVNPKANPSDFDESISLLNANEPAQSHSKCALKFVDHFVLACTILVAITAIRIEWLNSEAANYLPQSDIVSGTGNNRWRTMPWTDETSWKEILGPRNADNSPRPLSRTEQVQMRRDIAVAKAKNKLRDVVSTWGLVQYPLVVILLITSAIRLKRTIGSQLAILHAFATATALIAWTRAMYRGYFTAIG